MRKNCSAGAQQGGNAVTNLLRRRDAAPQVCSVRAGWPPGK